MAIGVSNALTEETGKVVTLLKSYRPRLAKYKAAEQVLELAFPSAVCKLDTIGGSNGKGTNNTETKIHNFLDMRQRMINDINQQEKELNEIYCWINSLPPDEGAVIARRYILSQNMEEIMRVTNWSRRTCWRLHDSGIRRLLKSWHTLAHCGTV